MSYIVGIVICLMLSAFFSGMEIAFVSSDKLLMEVDKGKGLSQKAVAFFYRHTENYISTLLIGNNIVLVVYGILFARLLNQTVFASLPPSVMVPVNSVMSTLVVLLTGEFLPKMYFKSNPNKLLTFFAPLAYFFFIILYPISKFTTFLSSIIMKILGIHDKKEKESNIFTKTDLGHLVETSINESDDETIQSDIKIFQNTLEFSDNKVRDCMIPRTELVAIDINCTTSELYDTFTDSGKSRVIIYEDNIDNVKGYIHVSEMFDDPDNWRSRIHELSYVPETMPTVKLLQTFLHEKRKISIVVDEFGSVSGIITLEDMIEDILGDMTDEHDNTNYVSKKVNDSEYILSARIEIDKVNEDYDLNLPVSDEYKTVSGLILHNYGSIPKVNEIVRIGDFEFKIIKSTIAKIELVRLKVNKQS